ncbi:MAG: cytochrome c1, partial [Ottowia sp.]|nr:cytochrome c1 [Ottowia sp.]
LLRSYYRDPAKPTGWDNTTFPSIGMPHPLGNLQGERKPVFEEHGQEKVFTGKWERVKDGALDEQGYDALVGDLVNFMQWMGEPAQARRTSIGIWVMLFMAFFTFLAWNLNKAYWKDVT